MPHRLNRPTLTKITLVAAAIAVSAALAITSAATATTTGTEHLSLINIQTNGSSPLHLSAIATGTFTAGGTAIIDSKAGTATLRFQLGTIVLKLRAAGRTKTTASLKACLETDVTPDTYTIASGTGIYDGITGSGKSTSKATFVGATVNGKCSNNTPADAIQIIITASGPVSLP